MLTVDFHSFCLSMCCSRNVHFELSIFSGHVHVKESRSVFSRLSRSHHCVHFAVNCDLILAIFTPQMLLSIRDKNGNFKTTTTLFHFDYEMIKNIPSSKRYISIDAM